MITTFVVSLIALVACQPQQTDIYTEIIKPDGTKIKYVNKGNGFGYNPNVTGNLNVGGVEGSNNATIVSGYGGGYGWGYGWGGYGWGGFGYYPGTVYTPGAAPIPVNCNVYNYNPGVYWNGGVYTPR